jgi:elongator complex protein 2
VTDLVVGHTDTVNVVRFLKASSGLLLLTGAVDKTVKVWRYDEQNGSYSCIQTLDQHTGSINCIAVADDSSIFASGAADGTVRIWSIDSETSNVSLVQTIALKPRFFPLALALSPLGAGSEGYVLAAAGTTTIIQLFVSEGSTISFSQVATLTGHEGWIRSLTFAREFEGGDLLLSSASQDKYIRLWRIHQGAELPAAAKGQDPTSAAFMPGKSLSNKAHRFRAADLDYSATFEALLLGHDDWIYSTKWARRQEKLQLLSASADNSLSIWEQDVSSGVWIPITRLGEISAQKGSTTATGSTGGFWTGLWAPNSETVVCLGRTGSWRAWNYITSEEVWKPAFGVSGHVRPVTGIAWSKNGDYLLSTSSDQTTRLHAKWKKTNTWHEMSRPQIHGYDLNCIDSLGQSQFVSGADEKLLRVFNEPRAVAELLQDLCGIQGDNVESMPDAANMPVLGLSNKAIDAVEDGEEVEQPSERDRDGIDPASVVHKSTLKLGEPPLEDHLSRHTLWPEIEKLYGHGYEISALAASHDGEVIATACKASSLDHAVIRLFETEKWTQLAPPLQAHSLTVTRLRFSSDDSLLLSVGRDRQWALWERSTDGELKYKLKLADPKGHSRMILDCAWAPTSNDVFATAGRDKSVKLWRKNGAEGKYECVNTIKAETPVTAVDFADSIVNGCGILSVGTEAGKLTVYLINMDDLSVQSTNTVADRYVVSLISPKTLANNSRSCPSKSVEQLAWRPQTEGSSDWELAVAGEDCSLRILLLEDIMQGRP